MLKKVAARRVKSMRRFQGASLFNCMDCLADALGVPAEGMQAVVTKMRAKG